MSALVLKDPRASHSSTSFQWILIDSSTLKQLTFVMFRATRNWFFHEEPQLKFMESPNFHTNSSVYSLKRSLWPQVKKCNWNITFWKCTEKRLLRLYCAQTISSFKLNFEVDFPTNLIPKNTFKFNILVQWYISFRNLRNPYHSNITTTAVVLNYVICRMFYES